MSKINYKKVDVNLLQTLVEIIAKSRTELNFLQMQELFKQIQESEDIKEDDDSDEEIDMKSGE